MRRLTPATVTFLMFGVVGALVAAYVVKGLMATEPPRAPRTRLVPMPVAAIPAGTTINAAHLGQGPVNESELQPDMLMRNEVIVGRVTKENLEAAKPIHGSKLMEFGATPPLKLTEGMRAFVIDGATAGNIVDGLIKPGEYIDVHFQPREQTDRRFRGGVIVTLLKGIKVLAINRQFRQNPPEQTNSLTVEVTPQEAAVLDLAKAHGSLNFRYNPEGKGTNLLAFKDPSRITLEEVLGIPEVPEAKPLPPFRAQLYRGTGRQSVEFGADNVVNDNVYSPPATPTPTTDDPSGVPSPRNRPDTTPDPSSQPDVDPPSDTRTQPTTNRTPARRAN